MKCIQTHIQVLDYTINCGKRQAESIIAQCVNGNCQAKIEESQSEPNIFYKLKKYISGKLKEAQVYHCVNVKLKSKFKIRVNNFG